MPWRNSRLSRPAHGFRPRVLRILPFISNVPVKPPDHRADGWIVAAHGAMIRSEYARDVQRWRYSMSIPTLDVPLVDWSTNANTRLTAAPATYGTTAAVATQYDGLHD